MKVWERIIRKYPGEKWTTLNEVKDHIKATVPFTLLRVGVEEGWLTPKEHAIALENWLNSFLLLDDSEKEKEPVSAQTAIQSWRETNSLLKIFVEEEKERFNENK